MNRSLDTIILRYVGYLLLALACVYLLYLVRNVMAIFMVAGLIAYALEPLLQRLEQRGYSRRGAVGFVFLVFLLLLSIIVALLASAWQQAQQLAGKVPDYQRQFVVIIDQNRQRLDHARLPESVKTSIKQGIDHTIQDVQQKAPVYASQWIQAIIGSLGWFLLMLIILPIITLWLMLEMNPLRTRTLMIVPPQYRRDVSLISAKINEILGRYVRGQMFVCSLFGVLCTITFSILHMIYGMEYWLVLGLVAPFCYIVPYIGIASIALASGMTAYFTSSAPVPCAIIAVLCIFAFNLTIDYGITPRVLGRGVGLHPLMVIFALLSGAQIAGIFGMILAIPFFASLRVVLIHLFPQLTAPVPQTTPEGEEPADPSLQSPPEAIATRVVAEANQAESKATSTTSAPCTEPGRTT
jgi:predicted PurR-regulated permease PerM